MMYVIGEAREALGENPTDAGIAAAYNPFVANSGRYTVPGNEVTYQAFVAKDPAYISEFEPTGGEGNAQALTFNIDDGTLTLSFGEGGGDARSDGYPAQAGRRRLVQSRECPGPRTCPAGAHIR